MKPRTGEVLRGTHGPTPDKLDEYLKTLVRHGQNRSIGQCCRPGIRQADETGVGHQVVVLDAHAGPEFLAIKPRFESKNVADLENIVPIRIDPWRFVGRQADTMTKVMMKFETALSV